MAVKFLETLRLQLNRPTVQYINPDQIFIPDGDEETLGSWQRKGVTRQIKNLTSILKEGFDVFAVILAQLPDGRFVAVDGGQRIRSARLAGCPKITALVYTMSDEDAQKAFFALGETVPIASSHKVHNWPGPAGEFIREHFGRVGVRMSVSQFVRGFASFLQGKSCMQIQKGLQVIDRLVVKRPHATKESAERFIEAQNRIFNGTPAQVPTMAVLASAILLNEIGDPRKGRLSQTDWKFKTNQLGSTQNTLPSWLADMRKGW